MRLTVLLAVLAASCAPSVETIARRTPALQSNYLAPTEGDSHAAAYRDLVARLKGWGITVQELDDVAGAPAGEAKRTERLIHINRRLTENGKLETLAHEAAHLLQAPSVVNDWSLSEVAADVVSHRVLRHYGLDNRRVSGRYLGQHKQGFAGLRYIEPDVRWAVDVLTGRTPFEGWR